MSGETRQAQAPEDSFRQAYLIYVERRLGWPDRPVSEIDSTLLRNNFIYFGSQMSVSEIINCLPEEIASQLAVDENTTPMGIMRQLERLASGADQANRKNDQESTSLAAFNVAIKIEKGARNKDRAPADAA